MNLLCVNIHTVLDKSTNIQSICKTNIMATKSLRFLHILLFSLLCFDVTAQSLKPLLFDETRLTGLKQKIAQQDSKILRLVDKLKQQADKLLDMKPVSVMDKSFTPASGNKHDYMSQAPYFWYDSSKSDGLPYLRRDGRRNPEINKITDHAFLGDIDNATRTLSLAWYLTGEEKYAEKAVALLRCWFLNDSTKMNSNLDYAQAIPGVNNGRGIGIIETIALTGIADAASLLSGSSAWKEPDVHALQQWYSSYLNWMLTSKNGNEEHAAKNNHGTWFYMQAVDFALFTGNTTKAKELAEESKKRIDTQIDNDGKMPLELERTNALHYSIYNLQAWFNLAMLAEKVKVDLWQYKNMKGAGIRTAFDWLLPYALEQKKWDYQQIGGYNKNEFYTLLLQAVSKFKDSKYEAYAREINKDDVVANLLYEK